jgi:hypothetical protein
LVAKLERFGSLSETDDMALAGLLSTQLVYAQFVAHYRPAGAVGGDDDVKLVIRRSAEPVPSGPN